MQTYQREFLDFAIEVGVLRFGEFQLKSGRLSPYFFNAGLFNSGSRLARLGRFYAEAIRNSDIDFDLLYGPAYKGIPLVAAAAVALAEHHYLDLPFAFNRKEAKDHGEGGSLIGAPLKGRVLIVDDVITAGTSVRESVDLIRAHGAEPAGVVIALDRQEQGPQGRSAIIEVEQDFGIPVESIVQLDHLVAYLIEQGTQPELLSSIQAYRSRYGLPGPGA